MTVPRKTVDPMYERGFLEDLNRFILKCKSSEDRESTTCETIFRNEDAYSSERESIQELTTGVFVNSKDRGDALENLVQSLFNRIELIDGITITRKQTTLGQLDLQMVTVKDFVYDVWGMTSDKPEVEHIIGECKNYVEPVGRPEIERMCWRASKGSCLSFFIANSYTEDAISEIGYFNQNKSSILCRSRGVYIIPFSLSMIEAVVKNDVNFCYFIKWAIKHSKIMSIANYLKLT
jgi:hypothetical protein